MEVYEQQDYAEYTNIEHLHAWVDQLDCYSENINVDMWQFQPDHGVYMTNNHFIT